MSDGFPGGANGRRNFLQALGKSSLGAVIGSALTGTSGAVELSESEGVWRPQSKRRIRIGVAGFGANRRVAQTGLQYHPNLKVVGVTDLVADRRERLKETVFCGNWYDSLELMLKAQKIDAVVVATGAPNHAAHSIEVLNHGKHVLCMAPGVFGSLDEAEALLRAVKLSGKKYMMAEPMSFCADRYAMRKVYRAGGFGKLIVAEGDSYQYMAKLMASHGDWRVGMPPMWDATSVTSLYVSVTGKRLVSVSCQGTKGRFPEYKARKNRYENPFADELALFETSEGGTARFSKVRSVQGHVERTSRVLGEMGRMEGMTYRGALRDLPDVSRPALPTELVSAGFDGPMAHALHEFVCAVVEEREPLVNAPEALAMSVPGIIAHESALKGGERMKIPEGVG